MVARYQDAPVGFMIVGDARDEDAPWPVQLWAMNVTPEHHGTGQAGRMMREGLGDIPAYLWVADGNERAIHFYQRHHFSLDGANVARDDGMTAVRMVRGTPG